MILAQVRINAQQTVVPLFSNSPNKPVIVDCIHIANVGPNTENYWVYLDPAGTKAGTKRCLYNGTALATATSVSLRPNEPNGIEFGDDKPTLSVMASNSNVLTVTVFGHRV